MTSSALSVWQSGLSKAQLGCAPVTHVLSVASKQIQEKVAENMWMFGSGKCRSDARLDGQTAVITGANTGIGYETTLELLKRGAHVIMACRNMELADAAANKLRIAVPGSDLKTVHLNLASLKSVRACAEELVRSLDKIHLLINNAGVMACPYTKTEDGLEMQFQTNHLGHFLLTSLLLDKIKRSSPARIINLSSHAHFTGKMNFEDLQSEKSYNSVAAYGQSKLCNVLYTLQLQSLLKGSGVVCYAVHPGVVSTELGRHLDHAILPGCSWLYSHSKWFIKTPLQGAQTTLHCALEVKLSQQCGLYFSDCREMQASGRARKKEDAARLWQVSEELLAPYLSTIPTY